MEYDIKTGKIKELKVGGDGMPTPQHHWTGNGDAVDRDGNLWFANQGSNSGTILKVDLGIPCNICKTKVFDYGPPPKKYKHDWPKHDID